MEHAGQILNRICRQAGESFATWEKDLIIKAMEEYGEQVAQNLKQPVVSGL
ncbi:MAG: hypothetical protein AABY22_35420 [Nanoarchaeota archaeon]